MVLGSIPGLDVAMVPAGNTGCPDQHGLWTLTWPQVMAQSWGIHVALDDNRSHRHQHVSRLQQGHYKFLISVLSCSLQMIMP